MNNTSIRTHLLLLVLAMCVPLVVVVGIGIYNDMQQSIAQTKASLRTLAITMVGNTGGKIDDAHRILERLAARPLVRQVDPKNCDPALALQYSLMPGYTNIGYTNLGGEVICSAVPPPGGKPLNFGETPSFRKFLKEQRFGIGEPYLGPRSGKWLAVLREPIWNERHEMVGAMQLPLDLAGFDPHIPSQFLPADSNYGFIAEDGTLIWRQLDPNFAMAPEPPRMRHGGL